LTELGVGIPYELVVQRADRAELRIVYFGFGEVGEGAGHGGWWSPGRGWGGGNPGRGRPGHYGGHYGEDAAAALLGDGGAGGGEEGGHDVDVPGLLFDDLAGLDVTGPVGDAGDVDKLFVERVSMESGAVVPKLFAVVGDDHCESVVHHAEVGQFIEQLAHVVVGVADFAVVEGADVVLVAGGKRVVFALVHARAVCFARVVGVEHAIVGRRRDVVGVGVEVEHEEEEGLGAVTLLLGPSEGGAVDDGVGDGAVGAATCVEVVEQVELERQEHSEVVVEVEPGPEPELGVRHGIGGESDGLVPGFAELAGEGGDAVDEGVSAAHCTVQRRLYGGEHGHDAGHGPARSGGHLVEPCAFRSQAIECGRGVALVAVAAHVIGPERVDHDEDDVGLCGLRSHQRGERHEGKEEN